jgi:outer membrane immunogenic protein
VARLSSSLAYGGEIGYDIPVSEKVTVGPYVAYDLSSSEECGSDRGFSTNITVCFKSKADLSVGVRAGLIAGRNGEAFIGIGYDKYDFEFSVIERLNTTNAIVDQFVDDKGKAGIGISFGYNHKIAKNLYVGAGARISELGKYADSDYNLQRFQGHLNVGFRF